MAEWLPSMHEPHSYFVSSEDRVQVAVHDYGGPGHPTLFVHGTGLVSRMWEPIINNLGNDFRAICVDLRAHGATTNPDDIDFFDHRMVADLASVVDAFNLQDAWVVGHSMGAPPAFLRPLCVPGHSSEHGYTSQFFSNVQKIDLSDQSISLRRRNVGARFFLHVKK